MDSYEDGVDYESLVAQDIRKNTKYTITLKNREAQGILKATLKITITERSEKGKTGFFGGHPAEITPKNFDEITRIKPKVPGLKESSFI